MTVVHSEGIGACRFRGEHPTVIRPASRLPLVRVDRWRAGALCLATTRGLRASSRPRLRDARYRRPAARNSPPRRTS
jgi:hypothetical protein